MPVYIDGINHELVLCTGNFQAWKQAQWGDELQQDSEVEIRGSTHKAWKQLPRKAEQWEAELKQELDAHRSGHRIH